MRNMNSPKKPEGAIHCTTETNTLFTSSRSLTSEHPRFKYKGGVCDFPGLAIYCHTSLTHDCEWGALYGRSFGTQMKRSIQGSGLSVDVVSQRDQKCPTKSNDHGPTSMEFNLGRLFITRVRISLQWYTIGHKQVYPYREWSICRGGRVERLY